jgi:titin
VGARNVISGNSANGVDLYGTATTGNLVQGNYIGTDVSGATALGNALDGILLDGVGGNTVGGTSAGSGNVICRSGHFGVEIAGGGQSNCLQGNFIGTDASGKLALGNLGSGVVISGSNSNTIGGAVMGARNIVSGNGLIGILITNGLGNLVAGNFVGTDVTGTNGLGNNLAGIQIFGANLNLVGGASANARNLISGNGGSGVEILAGASGNVLQGNFIGTDMTGRSALSNRVDGVHVESGGNIVGGAVIGAGNLISGNLTNGVNLVGATATGNLIQGNLIGTDLNGVVAVPNHFGGLGVSGSPNNTIGGVTSNAGNLISGNGDPNSQGGIYLIGTGATGNVIQGNKIGTDITGTLALGNSHEGIYLERSPANTIGGVVAGAGNLISANKTWGILLTNSSGNVIQGNLIGTQIDGVSGLGNMFHALECTNASNNLIGGTNSGSGNRLAFSQGLYSGARIRGGSTNDAILGNAIFSNGRLGIDLGTFGVNANISCDTSAGDNMLQNYPVLTQAVTGTGTGIRGTLNSRPNAAFLLQFFANPTCNAQGYGDGQFYLGQMSVVTSNNCNTSFVAALPGSVPIGYSITATATDSANNTSEFSACVPVTSVPTLKVAPASNHQVSIAWTNTTTGFLLKQTGSLSPPIQWTTVTNTPVVANGQFVVTLSIGTTNRFYVLSFQ